MEQRKEKDTPAVWKARPRAGWVHAIILEAPGSPALPPAPGRGRNCPAPHPSFQLLTPPLDIFLIADAFDAQSNLVLSLFNAFPLLLLQTITYYTYDSKEDKRFLTTSYHLEENAGMAGYLS